MELNGTIFLQVFIFLTLLVWLSQTLFSPIMRLFEEREQRIDGAKKVAAELNSLAEEKAKTFATQYDRAKEEARHSLTELKHAMDREFNESLDKVKKAAKERLTNAERELQEQEKLIRVELHKNSAGIAEDIVKAMMQRSA